MNRIKRFTQMKNSFTQMKNSFTQMKKYSSCSNSFFNYTSNISFNKSFNSSSNYLIKNLLNKSSNYSIHHSINHSISHSINHSICHSINCNFGTDAFNSISPAQLMTQQYNQWLYRNILNTSSVILFCQYNNMKNIPLSNFRCEMAAHGINVRFIIGRHFRELIAPDAPNNPLHTMCAGSIVLLHTSSMSIEPFVLSNVMRRLMRSKTLLMIGGIFEGKIFGYETLMQIANEVGSMKEVQSNLVSLLAGCSSSLVRGLEGTGRRVTEVLALRTKVI